MSYITFNGPSQCKHWFYRAQTPLVREVKIEMVSNLERLLNNDDKKLLMKSN